RGRIHEPSQSETGPDTPARSRRERNTSSPGSGFQTPPPGTRTNARTDRSRRTGTGGSTLGECSSCARRSFPSLILDARPRHWENQFPHITPHLSRRNPATTPTTENPQYYGVLWLISELSVMLIANSQGRTCGNLRGRLRMQDF